MDPKGSSSMSGTVIIIIFFEAPRCFRGYSDSEAPRTRG